MINVSLTELLVAFDLCWIFDIDDTLKVNMLEVNRQNRKKSYVKC